MLLLGIDIGTSFIKVSVVDAGTQRCIASTQHPEKETGVISLAAGWAEQSPDSWWENVKTAILKSHAQKKYDPFDIAAIGIAYQMHGLVMVDKFQHVVRNAIIWSDCRAVSLGERAFEEIGREKCLDHLLNSPGSFTAAKLAWVKENEPELYQRTAAIMLPGDFIAMKFTGNVTTTISALSEGIFWDFKEKTLSNDVFDFFGLEKTLVPEIKNVFSEHGKLKHDIATSLSLKPGIPVSYKAGDQLNNALSLNVLNPGEFAATAGTSGVIYGVTDTATSDRQSRINTFAHLNYVPTPPPKGLSAEVKTKVGEGRGEIFGVLLCINGTGILNQWVKNITGDKLNYAQMNEEAASVDPGSEGIVVLPFGNGAERMLNNKNIGAHVSGIDLNKQTARHLYRATQEGIAFAFRYGFDILKENGIRPHLIRAGKTNMFLSPVFTTSFVNTLNVPVELYETDGSIGAAIGAGIGAGIYKNSDEAFNNQKPVQLVEPEKIELYDDFYNKWLTQLNKQLNA